MSIRFSFIALCLCVPFLSSCDTRPDQDQLWVWVPKGRVQATVKPVVHNPQIEEAGLRFSAAVDSGNWWDEYTALHGNVPPYDERMGVTPEEYQGIIHHLEQIQRDLGEATLTFKKVGPVTALITCRGKHAIFKDVEVDFANRVASTPYGRLTSCTQRKGEGNFLSPQGPVMGLTFTLDSADDEQGHMGKKVELTLGVRHDIPAGVVYYSVEDPSSEREPIEFAYLLHYSIEEFE